MPESKRRKPRQKKPVSQTVRVIVDDEPVEALAAAQEALQVAVDELAASGERRVGQAVLRATDVPADRARVAAEVTVAEEDEAILGPLREAVAAAEEAVAAATDVYRFVALGRHAFDELIRAHPPTDEDHADARATSGDPQAMAKFHGDSFGPALVAACCVDPELTVDDAKLIFDEWNHAETLELFAAAWAVNQTRRVASLGKASGPMWSGVR